MTPKRIHRTTYKNYVIKLLRNHIIKFQQIGVVTRRTQTIHHEVFGNVG